MKVDEIDYYLKINNARYYSIFVKRSKRSKLIFHAYNEKYLYTVICQYARL